MTGAPFGVQGDFHEVILNLRVARCPQEGVQHPAVRDYQPGALQGRYSMAVDDDDVDGVDLPKPPLLTVSVVVPVEGAKLASPP
jgi:hypothetical protein